MILGSFNRSLLASNPEVRVNDDFYLTPKDAVREFFENWQDCYGVAAESCWLNPAVGTGNITQVVRERIGPEKIISCDIVDRGGDRESFACMNYFDLHLIPEDQPDYIIMNPPFNQSELFLKKALTEAKKKVIMFQRIQFLESRKRRCFFDAGFLEDVFVFSERVKIISGRTGLPCTSSTICFAWFVFNKYENHETARIKVI